MSPEQAKGRTVDARADVWAFGVVLFEMLSGQRAFDGEDVTDVLGAVVRLEPRWDVLPAEVPARARQVMRGCLQKNLKQRIAHIQDVRLAMEGAFDTATPRVTEASPGAQPTWRQPLPVAVAGLVVGGLLVGLAAWFLSPTAALPAVNRFSYAVPADRPFRNTSRSVLAFAPDGRSFVFNTSAGLFRRTLDQVEAQLIPGTEGNLFNPFFSPDSQSVAYAEGNQLKRIAISGGAPVVIGDTAGNILGASWEPDGTIFFGAQMGIFRIPATGGTAELVIPAEGGELLGSPQLLPGGDALLFSATTTGGWDEAQIVVQSLSSGTRTIVLRGGSDARFVPTGHLVYALGPDLLGIAFDVNSLAVSGGAVPLVQGVLRAQASAGANYGVSADGTLVYASGGGSARTLVWVDRKGGEVVIDTPPRAYIYPRLSPDGTQVALDVRDEQNDIWIWSLARETLTRLTFDPGLDRTPVWSPDGDQIAYGTGPAGATTLVRRRADGTGTVEALTEGPGTYLPSSFAPNGTQVVLYQADVGNSLADVVLVSTNGTQTVTPLVQTAFEERNGEVAPDGHWIAYESNESGQFEVYVRPFPETDSGGRWQVSPGGGTRPVWRADGGSCSI